MEEKLKKKQKAPTGIPRMLEEDLIKFIDEFSRGLFFTSLNIRQSDANLIPSIFMPLFCYNFSEKELKEIGIIYEYLHTAGPRSINGYPISCRYELCIKRIGLLQKNS